MFRAAGRLFLVMAFIWVVALPANADVIKGKVVGIADGDTITILTEHKENVRVRLAGIDTPERSQAFGRIAKENLSQLVFEQSVEISYNKTDQYGRVVGKVLKNGIDICHEQIRAGLAWHYKQYASEQSPTDRALYADAEALARTEQRGLWADPHAVAPWEYRAAKKQAKQQQP